MGDSSSASANIGNVCACNAGYTGEIISLITSPYFSGPIPCPDGSFGFGESVLAGYAGSIVAKVGSPFYEDPACVPVDCPVADTLGGTIPDGCTCLFGYNGSITASTEPPFYTSTCTAVPCPANSVGETIPKGCFCDNLGGYYGDLSPPGVAPFYSNGCTLAHSCQELYALSGSSRPYAQKRIVATPNGNTFAVRCDEGWTLVASRSSGVQLFNEPPKDDSLDPNSKAPGRVSAIWNSTNDIFSFRRIRFSSPDKAYDIAVDFGSLTSLLTLNNLPFSGTPLSGVTILNPRHPSPLPVSPGFQYFYWKAQGAVEADSSMAQAQIAFTNYANVGNTVGWDTNLANGGGYWVASGTRSADPAMSTDNAAGLVMGPVAGCTWSATCGTDPFPVLTFGGTSRFPNTLIWLQ